MKPIIAKQDWLAKVVDWLFLIPLYALYLCTEWAWRHYTLWIGRKWRKGHGKKES